MDEINGQQMSISSNSLSISDCEDSEVKPRKPKKKNGRKPSKRPRQQRRYTVTVANVPKRHYIATKHKLKRKQPVIELKSQTAERDNCDGFTKTYTNTDPKDGIAPESILRLIAEMRNSLQRRDFGNLAKLISMFTQMPLGKKRWYGTVIRYCLIVLLHDPLVHGTGLIDLFLEGVVGCHTDIDKQLFLKDIIRLPKNIHVNKYDDLWVKYSQPNQFDSSNINKLCKVLNRKLVMEPEPADSGEDTCSYDENESSDDESCGNETSDAEPSINLLHQISVLEKTFFI